MGSQGELRRRYLSLGTGELVAATVFALLAHFSVAPRLDPDAVPALWSALVPLLVILVQAGAYWLLARGRIGTGEAMPEGERTAYRILRVVNSILLMAGLIGVFRWWPGASGATVLCVLIWLFGVAEFVNYYVVRLAYPAGRWFSLVGQRRIPRLVRDLQGH
ncbi:hypothetical protein [Knoellia subterranea]|uniref:Uncharacterized protein n=1 Tax=Knoellia subterranea KCTC 19937 TaxID=1385521 RepID=A0A0A0JN97_9MICO|nr:hypothetical protein [Knoellia subterranea]KGN37091.1 hypothetical protein N803_14585 [Knoellia subterranea KCTC 19937]